MRKQNEQREGQADGRANDWMGAWIKTGTGDWLGGGGVSSWDGRGLPPTPAPAGAEPLSAGRPHRVSTEPWHSDPGGCVADIRGEALRRLRQQE